METQVQSPQYRLIKPFFCDDTFFDEGVEIVYDGVPNEAMEPLNDAAKVKMTEYIKALDDGMHASGRLSRKIEDIVFQEMQNRPQESRTGGQVILPSYKPETPIMGNLDAKGGPKAATEKPSARLAILEASTKAPPKVLGTSPFKE